MAFTQTVGNTVGMVLNTTKDSDGYKYITFGAIRVYVGSGSLNTVVTAPKGSLGIDITTPAIMQNTDGSTAWS